MDRIYQDYPIKETLTKKEEQNKSITQSAKEAFSKIPEEALKLIVPTSLSGSSKNTQPKKEYDAEFKDGDEVWHIQHGNGKVVDIDIKPNTYFNLYPIRVVFSHNIMRFTAGGKDHPEHPTRTLFHGQDLKVTVNEKKP